MERGIIVLTAFNRPGYLRVVLESLRRNNCWRWHLLCMVEPEDPQVYQLCNAVDFVDHTIIKNEIILGVRNNPHRGLFTAFERFGAEIVAYVEDDVVLAPDALDMAFWFRTHGPKECSMLRLFNASKATEPAEELVFTESFAAMALVLRRAAWDTILKPDWYNDAHKFAPLTGWDYSINAHCQENHVRLLMPRMSRALHIGVEAGTYTKPEEHQGVFGDVKMADAMRPINYRVVT